MAIIASACYCVSVRCTAIQDPTSSSDSRDPKLTKVILPKKKPPKWSTGIAPGEYGGPPTTSKVRKPWGEKDDPITSDDYIWNRDFVDKMNRLLDNQEDPTLIQSNRVKEEPSGFLSLNRAMSLDSIEIDLSKELTTAPSNPVLEQQVETARRGQLQIVSSKNDSIATTISLSDTVFPFLDIMALQEYLQSNTASPRWKLAPTRREQEKWDRATKAATGGSDVLLRDVKKPRGDPKALKAQAREQYFKLKKKMQLLTLGIGGVGIISCYVSYSPDIAASFGAGLLGSLAYVRMLGNSVDSMADGTKGLMKGAVAQPRLLVPVILVMIYNKWNGILVPEYGFMHLDLIPMLVGFFTYKIATFVLAIEEAVTVVQTQKEV